jgi:CubicO group peptidase (beta-lactamase class C family)
MKKHKLILLAVFTAISFLGMFLGGCGKATETVMMLSEPVLQSDLAVKLDEYMTAYNENCSYKYSGTILVAQGNTILLNKGYGMADYSKGIQNTPDKVLAIGSISKSFTALAIMQLAEKGLLNVNDPISKYITGHKRGKDITIHQLLTHTSGLPRDGLLVLGSEKVELKENLDYINKQPMLYEPGEKLAYSNAGYIMLAAIIEKVSGKTYNDYIRDNIFIPLGMNSSICGTDAAYWENQSVGYKILTGLT